MVTRRTERLVKKWLLWGGAALLAVMVLYLGLDDWNAYQKLGKVHVERVDAEKQLTDLRVRDATLSAAVKALDTTRGIEDEVRSRYPVAKPGEVEYVLVDRPAGTTTAAASTKPGLWSRIKGFFGF